MASTLTYLKVTNSDNTLSSLLPASLSPSSPPFIPTFSPPFSTDPHHRQPPPSLSASFIPPLSPPILVSPPSYAEYDSIASSAPTGQSYLGTSSIQGSVTSTNLISSSAPVDNVSASLFFALVRFLIFV